MHLISAERIIISDDRQRREFDDEAAADLVASILDKGLMHPIVIRGDLAQPFLVAGERRLRALFSIWLSGKEFHHDGKLIPVYSVPCVTLGELSPLAAVEAELEENTRRENLSWQEEADALARLHALREQQATERHETHSVAATALEIKGSSAGSAQAMVRDQLLVARHLADPEVAAAKSVREAVKVLAKREKAERFSALSLSVGATFSASKHTLLCGDSRALIKTIADSTFDVLCMDPPYGIDADTIMTNAAGKQSAAHTYDDSYDNWRSLIQPTEWFRVAKPQAHLYVFCDIDRFHELRDAIEQAGWWTHRTPLVYHKPDAQRVPWTDHGPRRCSEYVCYAVKGKRTTNYIAPDVFSAKQDGNTGHGAGKPVAAYRELLARSVRPGDTVGDFFMGTGSSMIAAHELKAIYTGIELDPQWHGVAVKRLQELGA